MIYTDFNLRIVADGDGFQVLAESAAGQASSPLVLPEETGGYWRDRKPERDGEDLFRALFAGDVGHLFDSSTARPTAACACDSISIRAIRGCAGWDTSPGKGCGAR